MLSIEEKIKELETRIAELESENTELRKKNKTHNLVTEVRNKDLIRELFGYTIDNKGVLKPTKAPQKINDNFQTFYTNVLRVLKPCVRPNSSGKSYRIVGSPQSSFNEKEWGVVLKTIDNVVALLYNAKKEGGFND